MVSNAVRCAPPGNRPLPVEETACRPFLAARMAALPNLRAIVTLGDVARKNVLRALGLKAGAAPAGHGGAFQAGPVRLFSSYHCSRLNTNTGRLTTPMFEAVFAMVRAHLDP
jgi:uracil-DNA glycosylase family 4